MIMNQILDPIKVDLKPNLLNIVNTHQPNPYKSGYNFYIIPTYPLNVEMDFLQHLISA